MSADGSDLFLLRDFKPLLSLVQNFRDVLVKGGGLDGRIGDLLRQNFNIPQLVKVEIAFLFHFVDGDFEFSDGFGEGSELKGIWSS